MTSRARLHSFGKFIPSSFITSQDIEKNLGSNNDRLDIPSGFFELMTGIKQKPIADKDLQVSDLAVRAAEDSFTKAHMQKDDVDLLIFAAASQDIIEPATANIIQDKLGLSCPAFDVKNACNSFMNGIEIAKDMVNAGTHSNILIVSGEMPSRVISYKFENKSDYKEAFASLTLGDGGGAAFVSAKDSSNISYFKMMTHGKHWKLATFMGGGSIAANDPAMMRFKGDGTALKNAFLALGNGAITDALAASGLTFDTIKQVFLHQVAATFTNETIDLIGAPRDKVYRTVEKQGNLASSSLPIAISQALDEKKIQAGDHILVVGLASGISVGVMVLQV